MLVEQQNLLLKFLTEKPEISNPYYLKKINSKTHLILWWDDYGEICYVFKSRNKNPVLEMASMIIDKDVEDYLKWYMKKQFLLYEKVKLHFSGTLISD